MLTQERLKELLDYDPETGVFTWKSRIRGIRIGQVAGSNVKGYRQIQIDKERHYSHRLAWLYIYGCWPLNELDHINRIKEDNRIANLREVTRQENCWNIGKLKTNSSGYTGVNLHKQYGKWRANIRIQGKYKHLGYFNTPEEAHYAYSTAKGVHRAA